MKKTDGWMPLYVADYLADTARLTTEQHGAYLLIIMDYWRNGAPQNDEETLAAITKLSVAQWRKHAPKILPLFRVVDGYLTHKRVDEERKKAGEISDKRSDSGKAGAAKRWGKPLPSAMPNGMANDMANACQEAWQNDAPAPAPSPEPVSHSVAAANPESPPSAREPFENLLLLGGVKTNSETPKQIAAWCDLGVTTEELSAAINLAHRRRRDAASDAPVNLNFVATLLAATRAEGAAPKKRNGSHTWWATEDGIQAKGRELGLTARGGESWDSFKARIKSEIQRRSDAGERRP